MGGGDGGGGEGGGGEGGGACTKDPTGLGQRAASPWMVMLSCARSACTCSGVSDDTSGCSR